MKRILRTILITSLALLPTLAMATVTPLAYYHLGEADPGALAGNTGNATTVDSAGTFNLTTRDGTPKYSSDVAASAVQHTGSTLSMLFNGSTDDYTGPRVSALTDNFGIEAWVKVGATDGGNSTIAYNGNGGGTGWGIYRIGSTFQVLYGGVSLWGSTPITVDQWVNLAVVRAGGLSTFYKDGVSIATSGAAPNATVGGNLMQIGGHNAEYFNGRIDEVRLFSFTSGAFSTNDLLINQIIPEPSTIMLFGLGLAGMFAVYRRRASR